MGTALRVCLVICFAAMLAVTFLCGYDCVIAHTEDAPTFLFSLVLPYWQEQYVGGGRFVSLLASVMLPGLALILPVVSAILGVLVSRRGEQNCRWRRAGWMLCIAAGVCLLINLYSVCALYRAYTAI